MVRFFLRLKSPPQSGLQPPGRFSNRLRPVFELVFDFCARAAPIWVGGLKVNHAPPPTAASKLRASAILGRTGKLAQKLPLLVRPAPRMGASNGGAEGSGSGAESLTELVGESAPLLSSFFFNSRPSLFFPVASCADGAGASTSAFFDSSRATTTFTCLTIAGLKAGAGARPGSVDAVASARICATTAGLDTTTLAIEGAACGVTVSIFAVLVSVVTTLAVSTAPVVSTTEGAAGTGCSGSETGISTGIGCPEFPGADGGAPVSTFFKRFADHAEASEDDGFGDCS